MTTPELIARLESADGPDRELDNPPAFPAGWPEAGYEPHYGMTLRDWFAGQALSNPAICTASSEYPHLDAYAFADAMLAERQKALAAAALKARGV